MLLLTNIVHHLGQAAAMLLLLELIVLLLIITAIFGGLAFGLHWGRGKLGWVFGKVNMVTGTGQRYVHLGTTWAAKPVILVAAFTTRVETILQALHHMAWATHVEQNALRTGRQTAEQEPVGARRIERP